MKEHRERWIILPFSLGCASQSSVAVGDPNGVVATSKGSRQARQKGSPIVKKSKYSLFNLPKPSISRGIRRLISSLKSVSQLFVYKDESDEGEVEMEIGYPTDVKHLTHIGYDGSTTINNNNPVVKKGWDNFTPNEIISFPSISLKQFELAMAAQANPGSEPTSQQHQQQQQLPVDSSSKPKLVS